MAESKNRSVAANIEDDSSSTSGLTSASHATAGLLQPGEAADVVSTRVPRGVGEPASDAIADDAGVAALQKAVQEQVEKISAQGFRGTQVDTTPNEAYTLRGVGRGDRTPETVVHTPKGR